MGFDNSVILVLRPPKESKIESPVPEDIISILKDFDLDLTLGCMRPGGKYRKYLDILAAKNNINTIVMPHPDCVSFCKENNFLIDKGEQCCVF